METFGSLEGWTFAYNSKLSLIIMLFYLVLLSLIAISSATVTYIKGNVITIFFKLITFLLFFLPIAFRYNVGADYFNYVSLYYEIASDGAQYIEPGYWWLNHLVYLLGGDAQIALAIAAFITLFFCFKDTNKEEWFIYSILFFVLIFTWCCSTVRQMISMSLAFYAFKKYNLGERVIPIVAILIASAFHLSSIIYPFLFLFCKFSDMNNVKAVLIYIITLFVTFIAGDWLSTKLVVILYDTAYGTYTETDWFDPVEIGSGFGVFLRYASYLIILLFFPYDKINNGKFILALFTLYVAIDIISIQVTIINRVGRGFIFCWLPCIYYLSTISYKHKYIVLTFVWLVIFVNFLASLNSGFNYCSPYISIFNK